MCSILNGKQNATDLRTSIGDFVNVGTGVELTIKELAETVRDIVYEDVKDRTCKISWDTTKPNGTPRKLCELTKLSKLGWKAKIGLKEGIKLSYDDFLHGTVRK